MGTLDREGDCREHRPLFCPGTSGDVGGVRGSRALVKGQQYELLHEVERDNFLRQR